MCILLPYHTIDLISVCMVLSWFASHTHISCKVFTVYVYQVFILCVMLKICKVFGSAVLYLEMGMVVVYVEESKSHLRAMAQDTLKCAGDRGW